eukprot:scaffold2207_cov370-Prasinococcus_capsulatus_cf.AAC.13
MEEASPTPVWRSVALQAPAYVGHALLRSSDIGRAHSFAAGRRRAALRLPTQLLPGRDGRGRQPHKEQSPPASVAGARPAQPPPDVRGAGWPGRGACASS